MPKFRRFIAKRAKVKSNTNGDPVCLVLVDSSSSPHSVMLARDNKGKLGPIGGKCKGGEDAFTKVAKICYKLLGWSPPSGSVLGKVKFTCTNAIIFVCPIDANCVGKAMLRLECVAVYDLKRLQLEGRLHNKLQFANRDELRRMQTLATSMPLVLFDDLLTAEEELVIRS
jgi:hypothetical protein